MTAETEAPDEREPAFSCGYQGYEFGGGYLDSVCLDGLLYDADSGDDDGLLTVGGEIPCPRCAKENADEG